MEQQERNQDVIDGFKQRRARQLMVSVPLILAIIPLAMMEDAAEEALFGIPNAVLLPVCIGVVIAGLIFSFINWRCPACRGYLGKGFSPKFCTKCGAQLQ